jgi:hypothetical protein
MFYFNIVFTVCNVGSHSIFAKDVSHLERMKTFNNEKWKKITHSSKGSASDGMFATTRFIEKNTVSTLVDLQGWLKYLELTENQKATPGSFKKNRMIYKQNYDGFTDPKWKIPNENYFYFELKDNTLSVYTTSGGFDRKSVQSMTIDRLMPVTNASPVRGGVEDIGNFDEGYCFMLKFIKSMKHYIWEICADSLEVKDNWMQAIIRLNQLQNISRRSAIRRNLSKAKAIASGNPFGDSIVSNSNSGHFNIEPISDFVLPRIGDMHNMQVSPRKSIRQRKEIIQNQPAPAVVSTRITTASPAHSLFANLNFASPVIGIITPPSSTPSATTMENVNIDTSSPNASRNLARATRSTTAIPMNSPGVFNIPAPRKQLRERTVIGKASNPLIVEDILKDEVQPGFVAGNWNACSKPCGQGVQSRTLSCVKPDKCSGEVVQKRVCNIKACKADVESHMEKLNKVAEGRWEYLGNWSPCSKPCGGGSQVIKRICLGQGNCIGEKVLKKPCNFFNCQEQTTVSTEAHGSLKECKNLHGEFRMLVESSKEYLPANVEINMNNVEVSYQNDPQHPLVILQLSNLNQIKASNKYPGCLKLVDESGRVRLCTPPNPEESGKVAMCEVWVKKIQDFKRKCSNQALEKIVNEITASASANNSDPFKQIDILQKKLNIKESKDNEIKEKKLVLQFEEFKKQAKELIEKEEAYEKKLESQEKNRIECEEKKMGSAILKEEAIANKILNDIQSMSYAEKSYKIKENAIKREMKGIMKNIQSQILNKREGLINKIQSMRQVHNIKQDTAMKHLLTTKRQIGVKLSNLNKKVSAGQCVQKRYDTLSIQTYCNSQFYDLILRAECSKPEQFCYMCCDKETDVKSKIDVGCCYNLCDNKPFDMLQCKSFYDKNKITTGVLPDDLLI